MPFDVIDSSSTEVALKQAILLYGDHRSMSYATLHDVRLSESNAAPEIAAGIPLQHATLSAIARNLLQSAGRNTQTRGVLPECVLSCGFDHLVWYVRPQTRAMFFDCAEGIGKRSGKASQPALIFAISGSGWRIYAIKTRGRPSERTPLYCAPYMNVWENGTICTGSTPLPDESVASATRLWTDAFFASNFSHPNHWNTVKFQGGCHAFWKHMLDDGGATRFPSEVLVPSKIRRLGDLLAILERGE